MPQLNTVIYASLHCMPWNNWVEAGSKQYEFPACTMSCDNSENKNDLVMTKILLEVVLAIQVLSVAMFTLLLSANPMTN